MKRKLTLFLALMMAALFCLTPMGAMGESAVSNEVKITPPTPVPIGPDLTMYLSLTPETVAPGSTMVCLLQLSNGGSPVTGKTVYLQLPAGFVPVNPEVLNYDSATNMVAWAPPLVGTNETVSLAIDVEVPELATGGSLYTFNAMVDDKTASASVTVADTTLSLSIRSTVKYAEPGDAVLYTIGLKNTGLVNATGLAVSNEVPGGMWIDPASIGSGGHVADGIISWNVDLAAGQTLQLKFLGVIPETAVEGDVFINTVEAAGLIALSSVTVYEPEPELSISKKVNNRTPAPGTTVKYTITVKNTGGADAYDVEVLDELPEELEINRRSITHGGSYSSRYDEINWTIDVPAYDKVTLTFTAYVPDWTEDGDVLVNYARIYGVGRAKATMTVTEGAVPKTGYGDVVPAAWGAEAPASKTAAQPAAAGAQVGDIAEVPLPPVIEAFGELYAKNNDLVGYLKVNTQVDLPIVQADNNDFYMVRNFDKRDDEAGALFLDERNHLFPSDRHLMIYGHNMKNGAMFGRLAEFRSLSYLQANPTFTFQAVYDPEPTTYAIVAVIDASMDEGNKDYLKVRRPNFDDEADAKAFIDDLKGRSYFSVPIEWDETDKILSLITCSYIQDNGRLLVVGRPLREGETVESVTALMAGTAVR